MNNYQEPPPPPPEPPPEELPPEKPDPPLFLELKLEEVKESDEAIKLDDEVKSELIKLFKATISVRLELLQEYQSTGWTSIDSNFLIHLSERPRT